MAKRQTLGFGPPLGVRNTIEPYDDATLGDFCQAAYNVYFRDPTLRSGAEARPGIRQWTTNSTNGGQGLHMHTATNGTIYNFIVSNGKLQRIDSASLPATVDVTPAAPIAIDTSASSRVTMLSLGDSMIVTDGVNMPWVATNLGATPVTGTRIDIDSALGAWTSGPPTIYQDGVCFPTITVPGGSAVTAGVGFVFSEPNQPLVGYTQTNYANFFNVIEQSSERTWGLWGTNNGLFYFRARAIGVLAGQLNNLSTTATRDARSSEVGTTIPWTIAQYGQNIFWADELGRAWMMALDGAPQPIWKQMAALAEGARIAGPQFAGGFAIGSGTIIPQMNAYALASFRDDATGHIIPFVDVFDGQTGNYFGRWWFPVSSATPPVDASQSAICSVGVLADITPNNGALPCFTMLGTDVVATRGDAVLQMARIQSGSVWYDQTLAANYVPPIAVTTDRLGYAAGVLHAPDTTTIITLHETRRDTATNNIPMTVRMTTPYAANTTLVSVLVPNASSDGTYRSVLGMDGAAVRGMQLTVSPNTTTGPSGVGDVQWSFQRIEIETVISMAGPSDS